MVEEKLANFSINLNLHSLPEEIIDRAKLLLLDSLTSVATGNQSHLMKTIINNFTSSLHNSNSKSFPQNFNITSENHSFISSVIYGMSMVCEELDEGNPRAKGHPSCHFFPALLTESIRNEYSGLQMLEAFIVGYEISARAGAAIQLRKEIHPHGSWGLIGGGYALGKIKNFTIEEYISMHTLTSSMPYISLWNPVFEGKQSRDLMIGLNNFHLLILPIMVESGVSSSRKNMEYIYSSILGDSIDLNILTEKLGEDYYLMSAYFKFFPYCRFCHSPMKGVENLIKENNIELEDIAEISIGTFSTAAMLNESDPINEYAGKFSIPYAVSSHLKAIFGTTLSTKQIKVFEESEMTNLLPDLRASKILIRLNNGHNVQSLWHHAPGDSTDKNLREQVVAKNTKALETIVGKEKSEQIVDKLLHLEQVVNFVDIVKLLK